MAQAIMEWSETNVGMNIACMAAGVTRESFAGMTVEQQREAIPPHALQALEVAQLNVYKTFDECGVDLMWLHRNMSEAMRVFGPVGADLERARGLVDEVVRRFEQRDEPPVH